MPVAPAEESVCKPVVASSKRTLDATSQETSSPVSTKQKLDIDKSSPWALATIAPHRVLVGVKGITFRKLNKESWRKLRPDTEKSIDELDELEPAYSVNDKQACDWTVVIEDEPHNPYDKDARKVIVNGIHVGYLPAGWVEGLKKRNPSWQYKPDTAQLDSIGTHEQQFVWITLCVDVDV